VQHEHQGITRSAEIDMKKINHEGTKNTKASQTKQKLSLPSGLVHFLRALRVFVVQ
jgi:hypothetical protein